MRPGPGRRPLVLTTPDCSHHRTELRPLLQELLSARSAAEWFDVLTEARIPCAPINDVRGGVELADRLGLQPVVSVGEGGTELPGIRNPIGFSATPASYDLVPPGLDADRDAVLAWLDARPQHA